MKRHPFIPVAALAAVLLCFAAAAPFISVTLYQSSLALRGSSTNLFSSNSVLMNSSVNLSTRTGALPATIVLSDRPHTFTAPQTFSSALTIADFTFTNTPGSLEFNGSDASVWWCDYEGSSAGASQFQCGLSMQAQNGGTWSTTLSSTPGRPGFNLLQTAADNRSPGTGSLYHKLFNTSASFTGAAKWRADFLAYGTNAVLHRVGWGTATGMSDGIDGAEFIGTNGLFCFRTRNNSVQVNSANTLLVPSPTITWLRAEMDHQTNGSPYVLCSLWTNSVLAFSEWLSGYPTNRFGGWTVGAWGFGPGSTNTATTIFVLDFTGTRITASGYR